MIYNFEDLRPQSTYPKYPPYVRDDNDYIETYFYNFYLKNKARFDAKGRTLLPVWWTTLAVQNAQINVQAYIDVLPRNEKWFAVSQHDDGIRYRLPVDTKHFGAGGNGGGIPIPLIVNPIERLIRIKDDGLVDGSSGFGEDDGWRYVPQEKTLFCSFIGSMTHPIRQQLFDYNRSQKHGNTWFPNPTGWNQTVPERALQDFKQITQASHFALAPRGYGLSSFRLYEIMQLGTIPVYVSDKHWLPWEDELTWDEFCVIIKPHQIPDLYNILSNISEEKRQQMLDKIKEIYPKYFSLEGMCEQILKRI
jgi:hypothetical protein